jgi:hypothetical protein
MLAMLRQFSPCPTKRARRYVRGSSMRMGQHEKKNVPFSRIILRFEATALQLNDP